MDDGGPCREFFSLAVQELARDGTIFQGPQCSRFFTHNVQGMARNKFFYAGMLLAVSFVNGCQLAHSVVSFFLHTMCKEEIILCRYAGSGFSC